MNTLAAADATTATSSLLIFLLPLGLLGWLMWTQRKRARQVATMQSGVIVGDDVCTTSGLFGTVVALDATVVTLDVGNGVHLRYDRRAIALKTAPAAALVDGQGE